MNAKILKVTGPAFAVGRVVAGASVALGRNIETSAASTVVETPRRVDSHLLEASEHPDYDRRAVKPPGWGTFKNRTQFTCLRGSSVKDDRLVGFAEELEKFTRTYGLGDVIWPSYEVLRRTTQTQHCPNETTR